jgi:hypothetical protein
MALPVPLCFDSSLFQIELPYDPMVANNLSSRASAVKKYAELAHSTVVRQAHHRLRASLQIVFHSIVDPSTIPSTCSGQGLGARSP